MAMNEDRTQITHAWVRSRCDGGWNSRLLASALGANVFQAGAERVNDGRESGINVINQPVRRRRLRTLRTDVAAQDVIWVHNAECLMVDG